MALLNGMTNNSKDFLVMLGKLAGGLNMIALFAMAIGLMIVAYRSMKGEEQYPAVKKHTHYETIRKYAPCLIPLALLMIFTAWRILSMLASNNEFSGMIGIFALVKAILI